MEQVFNYLCEFFENSKSIFSVKKKLQKVASKPAYSLTNPAMVTRLISRSNQPQIEKKIKKDETERI